MSYIIIEYLILLFLGLNIYFGPLSVFSFLMLSVRYLILISFLGGMLGSMVTV
jgi:hypothetical protein